MHRCPGRLAKCLAYTWIPSRRRGIDRVVNKPFCFQLFAPIGLRCGVELHVLIVVRVYFRVFSLGSPANGRATMEVKLHANTVTSAKIRQIETQ